MLADELIALPCRATVQVRIFGDVRDNRSMFETVHPHGLQPIGPFGPVADIFVQVRTVVGQPNGFSCLCARLRPA